MSGRGAPAAGADQPDQRIPCLPSSRRGAGMARPARLVDLSRRYARKPDLRPLSAPDWTIAVPDAGRGAGEGFTRSYDLEGEEEVQ